MYSLEIAIRYQTSDNQKDIRHQKQISDLRFQKSDIGYQASDTGYQVSNMEYRVSDVGCRISDLTIKISDVRPRVSEIGFTDIGFHISAVKHQISDLNTQKIFDTRYSNIRCHTSDIKYLISECYLRMT